MTPQAKERALIVMALITIALSLGSMASRGNEPGPPLPLRLMQSH